MLYAVDGLISFTNTIGHRSSGASSTWRGREKEMNNFKCHQQPHLTKVTFYSSSNFCKCITNYLTTFKLGRNDLGETDLGETTCFFRLWASIMFQSTLPPETDTSVPFSFREHKDMLPCVLTTQVFP